MRACRRPCRGGWAHDRTGAARFGRVSVRNETVTNLSGTYGRSVGRIRALRAESPLRSVVHGPTVLGVSASRPKVVVIGAGFGGLEAAKALRRSPVDVTVIDRENHHLFQPLLYQVATASLSPGDIAEPIRAVLQRYPNVDTLLGEVVGVDLDDKRVRLRDGDSVAYDYLVIAAGARTNYFGHPEWSAHASGLKSLRDALHIRERLLLLFEAAEREADLDRRRDLLSFAVIGGGPTGVEMAGAISELGRRTLSRDFRRIAPHDIRVRLVEMADRVLTPFDEKLSDAARRQLEELEVEVLTGRRVTNVGDGWLELDDERVVASLVVWASGVKAVDLANAIDSPKEWGQLVVESDCSLPSHGDAFAIGDIAYFVPEGEEQALPGVSPVAMQQGRHVARQIRRSLDQRPREPFRYVDKGMMATVGRSRAVAQSGALRLSGLIAWVAWLLVHLLYLVGFRNRYIVLFHWVWQYLTFRRGARLIATETGRAARGLQEILRGSPEEAPAAEIDRG